MKDAPAAAPAPLGRQDVDPVAGGELDLELQSLIDGIAALGRVDSLLAGVEADIAGKARGPDASG